MDRGGNEGGLVTLDLRLPTYGTRRTRRSDGRVTVTDGPFTEAKEVVGGFAILKANSKQAAIDLAKHFLSFVGQGECELRQLYEPGLDSNCLSSADQTEVAPQS